MLISSGQQFCVIGNLYDIDSDSFSKKSIFISDGKIMQILDGIPKEDLVGTFYKIELENDDIIYPNFINLHAHIGYNILPIWDSKNIWSSRHQWRNAPNYKTEISDLVNFIKDGWITEPSAIHSSLMMDIAESFLNVLSLNSNEEYLVLYKTLALSEIQKVHAILSEIMAVCGGTGVLLQTLRLDDEHPEEKNFIIRNTGNSLDMGINEAKKIYAIVDFYKPCLKGNDVEKCNTWKPNGTPVEQTSTWYPISTKDKYGEGPLKQFIESVNNNNATYHSTIAHIGEGKSGSPNNTDSYSKAEANELIKELKYNIKNLDNLKKANLVLVHANGFDYNDKDVISFFKDHNISIVWSPVSNLILYNDTLPIEKLIAAGINICLGTDWTPSGSKHMLDELKFAKHFCNKHKLGVSDLEIFKMATKNPSNAIGINDLWKIAVGGNADFFVLKNPKKYKNALELVFNSKDSDIKCSMINGRFVYGDVSFFQQLNVDFQQFPDSEGAYSKHKGVSLNKNINFNLDKSLKQIDKLLEIYSKDKLGKQVVRTKFLAIDDTEYLERIEKLKI